MLKPLLAATTALMLMSGVSFAETTYSDSTTKSTTGVATPLGEVDISKTTRRTTDHDGIITEKDKTVSKDFDHDRGIIQKDKTVTKDTDLSSNGDVTRKKTETTTIR